MGRAAKEFNSKNRSTSVIKRRVAEYGPFVVLLLVALAQIRLAQIDHLTPAKGGGFGMFSTVDRLVNRFFYVYAIGPGFKKGIGQPRIRSLAKDVQRARSLPVEYYLKRIAQSVPPDVFPAATREIRIEVWKQAFDPDTLQVRRIRVGLYRHPVAVGTGNKSAPPPETTKHRRKGASR